MDGKALKQYRIVALLTQRRLGELLGLHGISAGITVAKWEAGEQVPLKHFRKLHELIGIPYEKLVP